MTLQMCDGSFFTRIGQSVRAAAKCILKSHRSRFEQAAPGSTLIILANGPSLKATIRDYLPQLQQSDTLAVNFAANTPEFKQIRPKYYVLADPHFFVNASTDPNVARLIENLQGVDWEMTLFVPFGCKFPAPAEGSPLRVKHYNCLGAEGFGWLANLLYDRRRAMPRPRNVLIPSIMLGIWMGYEKIVLTGADHSWTQTLSVDEENHVVSIQPHFYEEDAREVSRIVTEYHRYPLHQILESFTIAFRAYHRIERYARRRGVEIVNATPGSFIDAFRRGILES